jgi:hypothetical protein
MVVLGDVPKLRTGLPCSMSKLSSYRPGRNLVVIASIRIFEVAAAMLLFVTLQDESGLLRRDRSRPHVAIVRWRPRRSMVQCIGRGQVSTHAVVVIVKKALAFRTRHSLLPGGRAPRSARPVTAVFLSIRSILSRLISLKPENTLLFSVT